MLISIARDTLERIFIKKSSFELPDHPLLKEKSGVFCTLNKQGQLRGCIGNPLPVYPLGVALTTVTKHSALEDPRFPPVTESELSKITIEITILTPPERLNVNSSKDYFSLIEIGRDGLIASKGRYNAGLLLPQVAVEQDWTVEEFLNHTCMKAGIYPSDSWKNITEVSIERFQGKIFQEKENNLS